MLRLMHIDAHWCTYDLHNLVDGLSIAFNPGVSVDRDFVAIIVSAGSSDWEPPVVATSKKNVFNSCDALAKSLQIVFVLVTKGSEGEVNQWSGTSQICLGGGSPSGLEHSNSTKNSQSYFNIALDNGLFVDD